MTTFDSTKASLNDLLREIREGRARLRLGLEPVGVGRGVQEDAVETKGEAMGRGIRSLVGAAMTQCGLCEKTRMEHHLGEQGTGC